MLYILRLKSFASTNCRALPCGFVIDRSIRLSKGNAAVHLRPASHNPSIMSSIPSQEPIVLDRLRVFERDSSGTLGSKEVRIVLPDHCAQRNAPGNLHSFDSLEAFREDARANGAAVRRALIGG